jgi:hypothetical protein
MRIRKSLLVASFLLLASAQVLAAPARRTKSIDHTGEIKFGPQIGGALGYGVFGEYALNNNLGVQVSLGYLMNLYGLESVQIDSQMGKNALASIGYLNLPVVLRAYPREERQFCWLIGFRIGYILNAKLAFKNKDIGEILVSSILDGSEVTFTDLKDLAEQDKVSKFQFGLVGGFDYEFKMGLTLGFAISKDFVKMLEAKDSAMNWTSRISLGYNFGRFLE